MIFFKNKEESTKFLRLNSSLDIKTFFNMIKNINATDSIMYNMTENEAAFLHSTIPESFDHYFHHLGKFICYYSLILLLLATYCCERQG